MPSHRPRPDRAPLQNNALPVVGALLAMLLLVVVIASLWSSRPSADSAIDLNAGQDAADQPQAFAAFSDSTSLPPSADPAATAIATTAPIEIPPTSAPIVLAPAVQPTATPAAAPSPESAALLEAPAPLPTAAESDLPAPTDTGGAASAAPAESPAAAAAAPEPTLVPAPTAEPTPAPTAAPSPTPEPTPVPDPTPQPTAQPTPTPNSMGSAADMELYMLGEINRVRAEHALPPLSVSVELSEISRDWSRQMAAANSISHRPQGVMNSLLLPGWKLWGENVATAPDIFWAQTGLERSPGHLENMVNPVFTHVGIGVVIQGLSVYVTQNFVGY